ncbi:alpha/beta hydrolase [Algiphilus sp.]|uniref:alpha/beta hydrolase n=1 Tax=Algiphilus sp. TaxID=1872431 RepID=UPI002A61E3E2|nr:alpha/beta hydrolase [Pseudomonadota bacterium]
MHSFLPGLPHGSGIAVPAHDNGVTRRGQGRLAHWARGVVSALVVLVLAGCAHHINAPERLADAVPEADYRLRQAVVYSPAEWPEALEADIYRPTAAGPHPGVLLVHGGGWTRGERGDMQSIAEALAEAGFVVMNISYRFAPAYRFPAQLHDLQQALRWMRSEAESLALDPARIAGFGYSAGAHLVSLLSVAEGVEALDAPFGGPDTRLQAVVAGGTPSDLRRFPGGELVPQFLGGSLQDMPERFALASPLVHVDGQTPPHFLYHGTQDLLVGIDHAEDLFRALQQAEVEAELYRMRLRGHITAFLTDGEAVERAIDFLRRRMPSSRVNLSVNP